MQFSKNRSATGTETLVRELESWIESENAYNSSVTLLSFNIENGNINGKFKDTWNNRVFAYTVQENRIGYKPAIDLSRTDGMDSVRRFSLFSAGYNGNRIDTSKGGKKPRCSAISYNCGSVCIPLQHTCWINGAGQRSNREGGSIESFTQGRIDKLRALAKYLESKGNNKWSRYGRSEDLKQIAKTVEGERAKLFKSGVKKQPLIDPLVKSLKKAFESGDFLEAKILARQAASKMKSGAEVATYLQSLSKEIGGEQKLIADRKKEILKQANEVRKTRGDRAAKRFYSENWNDKVKEKSQKYEDFISTVAREFLYVSSPSKMKGVNAGLASPKSLKKTGPLNQEQSAKLASGINAFKKMVGVSSLDGKQLRATALDPSFGKAAERSFYTRGAIYMADKAPVEVVVHEAAHWLEESDPKIHAKVRDFFEKRTQGEQWQKLSELTGNTKYRDDEVTKPDKWPKPYMGKKTGDKNSEILSMGMEMMYRDPVAFAKKDPEYFAFIHDTLRGK